MQTRDVARSEREADAPGVWVSAGLAGREDGGPRSRAHNRYCRSLGDRGRSDLLAPHPHRFTLYSAFSILSLVFYLRFSNCQMWNLDQGN